MSTPSVCARCTAAGYTPERDPPAGTPAGACSVCGSPPCPVCRGTGRSAYLIDRRCGRCRGHGHLHAARGRPRLRDARRVRIMVALSDSEAAAVRRAAGKIPIARWIREAAMRGVA